MDNIPTGTWIVVADGAGARVFTNIGDEKKLTLRQDDLLSQDDADGGPGKVPKEQSDADLGEAAFSHQLAHRLNAAALKNQFAHLVLIADPQSLGRIRPLLHKETQSRLLRELGKTMTNAPLEDIQRSLA
ncbi:MAG: host attachment family protein [Arenimonas sp.]|uniref:host attachment family protein n=1 Tax=Arenimonas sp. TaxID=1872635 RepID=UPI0025BDFABC|nr:host attachment family protein [Arenimonas sp.]MBW8368259.1 host attachment family protein [Arenimonas sp.]